MSLISLIPWAHQLLIQPPHGDADLLANSSYSLLWCKSCWSHLEQICQRHWVHGWSFTVLATRNCSLLCFDHQYFGLSISCKLVGDWSMCAFCILVAVLFQAPNKGCSWDQENWSHHVQYSLRARGWHNSRYHNSTRLQEAEGVSRLFLQVCYFIVCFYQ